MKPLALNSRPLEFSSGLSRKLEARGFEVLEFPLISFDFSSFSTSLASACASVKEDDWLVVTSRAGARAVASAVSGGLNSKLAALGAGTKRELQGLDLEVNFVSQVSDSEGLGKALVAEARVREGKTRVLLARADVADSVLPDILRDSGFNVSTVTAYSHRTPKYTATQLVALESALALRPATSSFASRVLIFSSSRGVEGLIALFSSRQEHLVADWRERLFSMPAVVIGKRTALKAESVGFRRVFQAKEASDEAIAASALEAIS